MLEGRLGRERSEVPTYPQPIQLYTIFEGGNIPKAARSDTYQISGSLLCLAELGVLCRSRSGLRAAICNKRFFDLRMKRFTNVLGVRVEVLQK